MTTMTDAQLDQWWTATAKSASFFYHRKREDRALIAHVAALDPAYMAGVVQKHLDETAWAWPGRVCTEQNIMAMLDTLSGQRIDAIADQLRRR